MPSGDMRNIDPITVAGFGREWSRFMHDATIADAEIAAMFNDYFHIFPWDALPVGSVGIDVGCGSGRWANLVAPRVGHLHVVDASAEALEVACINLAAHRNVTAHLASVSNLPVSDRSLDFAFSLGVLHHVPDTVGTIGSIARKLKPGAPFLVYLYYAFDNRPVWYRALWRVSDRVRRAISSVRPRMQYLLTSVIAATIYWPLARAAALFSRLGIRTDAWPLSAYRDRSFYTMRTDAYDRFCTRLEKRFTHAQIETMLSQAGFGEIRFSERPPFWCAVARKL
jgi:ubiquinone/menaquinone biosynthesis C-methylase UbiE